MPVVSTELYSLMQAVQRAVTFTLQPSAEEVAEWQGRIVTKPEEAWTFLEIVDY